jgi:RNA polymerase sigma factor (sigma-70 family)
MQLKHRGIVYQFSFELSENSFVLCLLLVGSVYTLSPVHCRTEAPIQFYVCDRIRIIRRNAQLKNVMKTEQQRYLDTALIERCIRGDQDAWRELVNRYQRLVYSIARLFCPPGEDVSDIFQHVWLECYQHLPQLRNVDALPGWLSTVTRRRAFALIRSRRGFAPIDEETPDHSERLRQIENEHMIERALDQLPDRCRTLINLLYFDVNDRSYSEIGAVMGMPEASIGPTRARCLEKLRKLII